MVCCDDFSERVMSIVFKDYDFNCFSLDIVNTENENIFTLSPGHNFYHFYHFPTQLKSFSTTVAHLAENLIHAKVPCTLIAGFQPLLPLTKAPNYFSAAARAATTSTNCSAANGSATVCMCRWDEFLMILMRKLSHRVNNNRIQQRKKKNIMNDKWINHIITRVYRIWAARFKWST